MKFQVRTSMRRHCLWLLSATVAFCAVSTLQAQQSVEQRHVIFTPSKRAANASGILSANRSVALDVDMNRFRSVAGPVLHIAGMPLATGVTADLDLREYTIIGQNAQLSVTDDKGVHPLPSLTAKLYRGKVTGDESSDVYLAFSESGVMGMVTTAGKGYEIASDFTAPASSGTIAAVSAPSAELTGNAVKCGVDDNAKGPIDLMSKEELAKLMQPHTAAAGSIDFSVIGAFDADYEFVQLFSGNKQAAADYMVSTIGQVSAVYERDLNTQLVIGYMNLWDTQSDPYTQSGVIQLALEEARDYWMNNRDTVTRGFTNVFSGKPWTGAIGVAYLGGLCYKVPAIGFCGMTRTNPTRDTRVMAHETGHIFGSKHTHDCGWPGGAIDQCAAAEGGSCFSQVIQTQGTIMSYCNQSDFRFHEKCAAFISATLQSGVNLPCLILSRALSAKNYLIVFPVVDVGTRVDTTIKGFYYNQSKEAVTVTKQEMTGNNVDKFTVEGLSTGFTLGPGESKDLKISYKSDEDVASQAVLTITHTGMNPAPKVTLEAYSLTNKPSMAFFADPKGEVNWGVRKVGRPGDTLVPNLYGNIGRGPLHVTKTEIVGPDRFEFELLEGSAPFDLEKQQRLSAKLRVSPRSVGTKVAYLRVEHNASTQVDSVKLTANVEQGPLLQVKANDLVVDFHDCIKGESYDSTFSQFFSNVGSDTMMLSFFITGPDADLFNTNTSGLQEMIPGSAIDFHVGFFAPPGEPDGQKQAQLVINPAFQFEVYDTLVINLLAHLGPPASVEWTSQKNAGISVVPNPTAGDADVHIAAMPDEIGLRYTLRLTDALGQELDQRNGTFTGDGISYRLKGKGIAAGVYYISVTTEQGTRVAPVTLAR